MNGYNYSVFLSEAKISIDNWIKKNQHLFFLNEKSMLEYEIMKIFSAVNDSQRNEALEIIYNSYFKSFKNKSKTSLYNFINNKTQTDYEQLELLVVYGLFNDLKPESNKIVSLLRRGIINYLINTPTELPVLGNRYFDYAVTHTIFWGSLYNQNNYYLYKAFSLKQIKCLLKKCLSVSLINNDIDVLIEVLACINICCKKSDLIYNSNLFEYALSFVEKNFSESLGHIIFSKENDNFGTCYHPTLALRIMISTYIK